ncbi:hypothetical protein [Deinococcus sp. Marseille-Q6407]|uniref:hypothetical protein n=1 Tax=Deinococcus sp. Marseille-Q6407 TaxID=2969223 RepID=UPI0021C028D3|nr:hypothetical protein [Deinococcus sp. Marseille-Q6407]
MRTKDALGTALLAGLIVATTNDNTLLVPSPFFAELFWITAGVQLTRLQAWQPGQAITAAGLLAAVSFPVWATRPPTPLPGELLFFRAAAEAETPRDYDTYSRWQLAPGEYRVLLRSCTESCTIISTATLATTAEQPVASFKLSGDLRQIPEQRLELQVYPGQSSVQVTPLATHSWKVRLKP